MRKRLPKITKEENEMLEQMPLKPTGESIPVDCEVGKNLPVKKHYKQAPRHLYWRRGDYYERIEKPTDRSGLNVYHWIKDGEEHTTIIWGFNLYKDHVKISKAEYERQISC